MRMIWLASMMSLVAAMATERDEEARLSWLPLLAAFAAFAPSEASRG